PWGVLASLAWGVAAIATWLGAQILIGDTVVEWLDSGNVGIAQLASDARFVSLMTIGAVLVPLAVIAIAVRLARCSLSEYLGLHWPARGYLAIGLAVLAVLIPLVDLVSLLAGHAMTSKFVTDLYSSGRDSGWLPLLVISLAVAAPLVEETVFRGFLLPGLAASRIGAWGAILLTSVTWAVLHAQYHPFYLAQIVVLGIAFGWLRLKSGSTTLTMILHGLLNLVSLVQAAIVVEWLS
ncbi:MAG: CPBP family intramembrane glutamic endopeptidase, partial [Xanthobacteraceae bacterium]